MLLAAGRTIYRLDSEGNILERIQKSGQIKFALSMSTGQIVYAIGLSIWIDDRFICNANTSVVVPSPDSSTIAIFSRGTRINPLYRWGQITDSIPVDGKFISFYSTDTLGIARDIALEETQHDAVCCWTPDCQFFVVCQDYIAVYRTSDWSRFRFFCRSQCCWTVEAVCAQDSTRLVVVSSLVAIVDITNGNVIRRLRKWYTSPILSIDSVVLFCSGEYRQCCVFDKDLDLVDVIDGVCRNRAVSSSNTIVFWTNKVLQIYDLNENVELKRLEFSGHISSVVFDNACNILL
jgi:hypothetical protein